MQKPTFNKPLLKWLLIMMMLPITLPILAVLITGFTIFHGILVMWEVLFPRRLA